MRRGVARRPSTRSRTRLKPSEDRPLAWYTSRVLATLAFTHALRGDVERGTPLLERALAEAETTGVVIDQTRGLTYLALTSLWAGRREQARQLAERALALSRLRAERGDEAWALAVLGEIEARGDAPSIEAGVRHLREALSLGEALEMRSFQARRRLALGHAQRSAGRSDEARGPLGLALHGHALTSRGPRSCSGRSGCRPGWSAPRPRGPRSAERAGTVPDPQEQRTRPIETRGTERQERSGSSRQRSLWKSCPGLDISVRPAEYPAQAAGWRTR